ncbi:TPA_asm: polyprotein [Pennisetum virus 1]|uniref:RNA-directed RNA polymerase n=1 Tax=Pennisetum virus 1 TaxID=2977978 RepID=A0A9N7AAT5_9RHAB|nr:TPA_asm: polyprotein [Pennisetum virus 1]
MSDDEGGYYNDEYGEELGFLNDDEGPLTDMHLASAINLDQYREILEPGSTKYRINIPRWLEDDTTEVIKPFRKYGYKIIVGMLDVTLHLSRPHGEVSTLGVKSYKEIMKMVGLGMKKRGYSIPITMNMITTNLPDITVYSRWAISFERIIQLICARAEHSREGRTIPYKDIKIGERGVCSILMMDQIKYEFIVTKNCTAVVNHTHRTMYIGDINCLLLMMDTLGQRICLYVSNEVAQLYSVAGSVPRGVLDNILMVGDQLLRLLGNDGYDIIAMYEAIIVGVLLKMSPDKVTNAIMFLGNSMSELSEMAVNCRAPQKSMELIMKWVSLAEKLTPNQLSNVFCLYRCWGHPIVDIYDGMAKVHRLGTEDKHVDIMAGTQILCQFRKTFLINYFSRNHFYPPVTISPEVINSYVAVRIQESLPIEVRHPHYSTTDFLGIEIGKIWDVPLTYDLCHILNDKAVTPSQSELVSCVESKGNTLTGVNRRGLLRWIQGSSINCRQLLQTIDEHGIDEDDCIIGMYEKEREIKIVARMFSLMSEYMRYYFVITEDLIATYILPLFPEITMKDPLNVLQKKFWTIGGIGKDVKYDVNINIDFSKWNLNMRDDLTNPLFKQIDLLFGLKNVVSRTHEIFEKSYVYSSSGKYVPPTGDGRLLEDPPMAYRGHKGGFEGLRQKGWTIATVCALLEVAEKEGAKIRLMGQGDNQIVRLLMPFHRWKQHSKTDDEMIAYSRNIQERFVSSMDIMFQRAKLPIKLRETWMSTRLFMYGKMMLHDGLALPQWYKKVLRSYALTNEGQVTISGVIGTIATNMAAAAGASDAPDVMYVLFVILAEWSIRHLVVYHPYTRESVVSMHDVKLRIPGKRVEFINVRSINIERLIAALILVPTAVGGSVTIPLPGFIMRGFPDHASEGYAWLKMLAEHNGPYQQLMRNWYSFLQNDSIEADMLLQSPWALNHRKPPTPGLQSRDAVRKWLLDGDFNDNQFIRESGIVLQNFDRKQVSEALLTDPMNPLITSEVFAGYPQSYLDGILRRVENTRTIKKLALKSQKSTTLVKGSMDSENNHLIYMGWRGDQKGIILSECATEQARLARNIGWGRTITGVTTPHPLELCIGTKCSVEMIKCPVTDYIYTRVNPDGGYAPYLGSKIKLKVISEQDIDARREPLIAIGARICRQAHWIGMGPHLLEVVNRNVACVCDISIYDKFMDDDPRGQLSTGSIDHRFNPAGASEGVFINYAPQLGSNVYMSSDNMPKYGRGQTNYTLHFQGLYCWLQYQSTRATGSLFYHWHLECERCIVPTVDEIPDLVKPFPYFDKIFSQPVVESIKRALGFIDRRGNLDITVQKKITEIYQSIDELSEHQLRSGVSWAIALKISFALTHGVLYENEDSNIEDLQEFPRIYSYKLYQDIILDHVVLLLIMITAIDMETSPEGTELSRVKRGLIDKLLNLPLSRFKGLASIYVGRNVEDPKKEHIFATGAHPETVVSLLKSAKNSVIEMVGVIGTIKSSSRGVIPIPMNTVTNRQFSFFTMFRSTSEHLCSHYMQKYRQVMVEDHTMHPECPHGCTKRALLNTPIVKSSMDKILKHFKTIHYVRELTRPRWARLSVKTLNVSTFSAQSSDSYAGMRVVKQQAYRHRERAITLPSSGVYKWSTILSIIPLRHHIIIFGDHTGCISLVCSTLYKNSRIYPSAQLDTEGMIPQDLSSMIPELARGCPNVKYTIMTNVPDKISDARWLRHMKQEIELLSPGQVTVIIDQRVDTIAYASAVGMLQDGVQVIQSVSQDLFREHAPELQHMSEMRAHYTHHGGHRDHEIFFEYTIKHRWSVDSSSMYDVYHELYGSVITPDESRIKIERKYIEDTFKFLSQMSRSLSMSHLNNLRLGITQEILKLPGHELWMYALDFLNKHYRNRLSKDPARKRALTAVSKQEIGRALLITLGLASDLYELMSFQWEIRPIQISNDESKLVLYQTKDSPDAIVLTQKDWSAYECLKYDRIYNLEIPSLSAPTKESWLYKAPKRKSFARTLSVYSSEEYVEYDEGQFIHEE